ncbi:TPM domain-containing protein [Fischerella sp. JS2]|uniref:TPM domain-containing protein n=1 Tax=Fischerella sp. JS2 TaxID=2597771 RepID=UPI0028EFD885|nr:TPM domain-containing protein [Fischerella sp. JS2]
MKLNLRKYKHVFWLSLFSSAILLSPVSSLAVTVQEVPNPRQQNGSWVSDTAGILSNKTEAQINQIISQLEAKNGTEMAVVTVPETSPAGSPKKFATELFNNWGIGKKGQDNGVLFLISVGDRRVEIETGYGVEEILPDAKVGNIIDTQIIPRFKKGDFEGGTLAGTKALVIVLEGDKSSSGQKVITPNQQPIPNQETTSDDTVPWGVLIGGGTAVLAGVSAVFLIRRPRKVVIAPEGHTRKSKGNYIFLCADCQQPMEKVDETTVNSYLSKPEKTAQNLGSVKFEGWRCPNCSHKLSGNGFHIVAQESHSSRFHECPHCQELTITRTNKIVRPATQFNSGIRIITDDCHSCAYHHQKKEIIPRLPPPPPPPPPTSHGGGFSGGGYSGGGGSFGGGSSGGGGAGGSW